MGGEGDIWLVRMVFFHHYHHHYYHYYYGAVVKGEREWGSEGVRGSGKGREGSRRRKEGRKDGGDVPMIALLLLLLLLPPSLPPSPPLSLSVYLFLLAVKLDWFFWLVYKLYG